MPKGRPTSVKHRWDSYGDGGKTRCGMPSPLPKGHQANYNSDKPINCPYCRYIEHKHGHQFVRMDNIFKRFGRVA